MTEQPSLEICLGATNAPVLDAFMADQESFCSVIIGPLGSGKTYGCAQKALAISDQQEPDAQGVRPTRGYVIRNTYRDLFDTSIRDFTRVWDGLGIMKKGGQERPHFEGKWKKTDGTTVEAEVIFIAIDTLADVDDLRGLQATWIWFNEMKELTASCVALALGRTGRFPEPAEVAPTWSGAFGDTNAPDEDQWLYRAFEDDQSEQPYAEGGKWTLYRQPGGVLDTGERNSAGRKIWKPNPDAENAQNLIKNYYARQLTGNKEDWISVNLANNYGFVASGQPVHSGYIPAIHEDDEIRFNPDWPLLIGIDYGRTPAAVVLQFDPQMGRYHALWEFVTHNNDQISSAVDFAPALARMLRREHPECNEWEVWGDPAGEGKKENNNRSAAAILRSHGIPVKPSPDLSNNFDLRQSCVDSVLKEHSMDGRPRILFHRSMKMVKKGLAGRYQFKRKGIPGEERYHDVPDKNDYSHPCFAAETMIDTPEGPVPIASLWIGDIVSTPLGPRPIQHAMSKTADRMRLVFSNGAELVCTPEHPFMLSAGQYSQADALDYADTLITRKSAAWIQSWSLRSARQRSILSGSSRASATITNPRWATTRARIRKAIATFIGWFGSPLTGLFPPGMTSTIGTTTAPTTDSGTSGACQPVRMPRCTQTNLGELRSLEPIFAKRFQQQLLGDGRTQEKLVRSVFGGPKELQRRVGQPARWNLIARSAEKPSKSTRSTKNDPASAREHAPQPAGGIREWMTSKLAARYVRGHSRRTDTERPRLARLLVRRLYPRGRVYNIEVSDAHCYYAEGMLVSNCEALQYALLGNGEGKRITQRPRPKGPRIIEYEGWT